MKRKVFTVLMLISSLISYSQTNIYENYNGDFELGNITNWRALEVVGGNVLSVENDITSSAVNITTDSYLGETPQNSHGV